MTVATIHGTRIWVIELIINEGLLPGGGQHDWLGYGVYVFIICADAPRGPEAALANAIAFAKKKYGKDVGCVFIRVNTQYCLDLQHPEIFAALRKCDEVVKARAEAMGLKLEANAGWTRPEAHFAIDAFCLGIEALSSIPIHVVRTQFSGAFTAPVEEIRNPELCIKNPAAILEIKPIQSPTDIPMVVDHPDDWLPSNAVLKAAKEVSAFFRRLSDSKFADLIFKIAEGANHGWHFKPRFQPGRNITLVVQEMNGVASDVERIWRSIHINNLSKPVFEIESLKGLCGPERSRKIDELIAQSSGLIVLADAQSTNLSSILLRARENDRPLLLLATKDVELPCEICSMRNVSVFQLKPKSQRKVQLEAVLAGFMTDDWKGDTLQVRMQLMDAARYCNQKSYNAKIDYYSDIKKLIEKDRQSNLLGFELPGLFEADGENHLHNLPFDTEIAAQELRERLNVTSMPITRTQMLGALGRVKFMSVTDLTASGYLIPNGMLGPYSIVAVKEGEGAARRNFTVAHEIAHAILDAAKWSPPQKVEQWCDELAAALLMPQNLVSEFSRNTTSLGDWFEFAHTFRVSAITAMKRIWQCERKLLVISPGIAIEKSPMSAEARQLVKLGESVSRGCERWGALENGVPYIIRRSAKGMEAIADFAVLTPHNSTDL